MPTLRHRLWLVQSSSAGPPLPRLGLPKSRDLELPRATLARVRDDLSIPEVRTQDDWDLFVALAEHGPKLGDKAGVWQPHIAREVDMTRDRVHFRHRPGEGLSAAD